MTIWEPLALGFPKANKSIVERFPTFKNWHKSIGGGFFCPEVGGHIRFAGECGKLILFYM
jgi:hypothetical protein